MKSKIVGRFIYERKPAKTYPAASRTQQHFKKDADINNIMRKYQRTGVLVDPSIMRNRKPIYGDFSNLPDYQQLSNQLIEIDRMFMALPSELRARFQNDPKVLVDFVSNPDNEEAARKLGLLQAPASETRPEATPEGSESEPAGVSESEAVPPEAG